MRGCAIAPAIDTVIAPAIVSAVVPAVAPAVYSPNSIPNSSPTNLEIKSWYRCSYSNVRNVIPYRTSYA